MIPIRDVIPTRTPPVVTLAAIAANVMASPFLHDGFAVLGLNLLCLWVFGGAVEDRLGHARFAAFCVLCSATAIAAQWFIASALTIGTSGGVAGVMGAYFLLFPTSRVLALVPFPPAVVEIPAIALLGIWVSFQLLLGMGAVTHLVAGLAGFLAGVILCLVLRRPERIRVEWWSP